MSSVQALALPEPLANHVRSSACDMIVTGGGGWVGSATLEMLESVLGDDMGRRVKVFGSSKRDITLRSGRTIACASIENICDIGKGPAVFFHCAFLTKDRLQDQSVDAFIAGNKKISDAVVNAIDTCDARGLFMPSSGAVYKKNTSINGARVIDTDVAANPYGVMKHADEERFLNLAHHKKMPVCIPRLFNLAGPFINKIELYALASMIHAVLAGGPITIRAPHRVFRSYIHVADLIALGCATLFDPCPDDAAVFDTAGEETVELGDLAKKIISVLDRHGIAIERPDIVMDKDDYYVGSGTDFTQMLEHHGLTRRPFDVQILDTAAYVSHVFK